MLTSIDVKFLSSTAYFSSSSEDILQTLFFISVFFILFSFNLIKVLKILLYVSLQRVNNCLVSGLYFDSHRIHELCVFSSRLSFTVGMFIAHATELVHRSTSMYQRPCPFRTSDYCFTMLVFRMISATVIGLRLESDIIFSQFLKLSSIRGICDINLKKERKILGVVWTLLDTANRTPNDHGDKMQV